MRFSFSVSHDASRAAASVEALPSKLKDAMRDAGLPATKALESVVGDALTSKAGANYWPVRTTSESTPGGTRSRVVVSKSKAHRIEPTKAHGILANPATGFFSRGGVNHPGSNPPSILSALESSPLGEVERPYREGIARVFGGL